MTVWSFHRGGPEGTRSGVLELHVELATKLAFARRTLRLASGDRDGAVVVWLLRKNGEGGPIGTAILPSVVADLFWRPDGRALLDLTPRVA